jgi:hypothetical protein
VWNTLLTVVGAVTGVAALVYFLGAASLWLALRGSSYSSDIGIEHEPRSLLIGLGLRGIFFVGLLSLLFAATATILLQSRAGNFLRRARFRRAAAASLLLLFAASWVNWRWFALAIAIATLIVGVSFRVRLPGHVRRWHLIGLVFAAVLSALAWQYGGPVYLDSVRVRPALFLPVRGVAPYSEACPKDVSERSSYTFVAGKTIWITDANPCRFVPQKTREQVARRFSRICPVPYFGESGSYVYVGAIEDVDERAPGRCFWNGGPIVELPRALIRLRFPRRKAELFHSRTRPIEAIGKAFLAGAEKLD